MEKFLKISNSNQLMITWYINKICNFSCNYCSIWHNKEKLTPIDADTLSESLELLKDKWIFNISGGEPFLEKNIVEICKVITQKHHLGGIYTNFSTKNIFDFADQINPEKLYYIDASIHILEREKRDPQLKSFIEKALYLQKKGFNIIASYVPHPALLNRVEADISYLKDKGIKKVRVKNYVGIYNDKKYPESYTAKERKFLTNMDMDDVELKAMTQSHKYFGNLCNAGHRFFVMDRNGNLTRCLSSLKNYGNLFNKTAYYDPAAKPCPINKYLCINDCLLSSKFKKGSNISLMKEKMIEHSATNKNGPKNIFDKLVPLICNIERRKKLFE